MAGLAVAVLLAGAGTVAANDWLPIFEAERIEAVGFRTADLTALPDLSAYGDVEVTSGLEVHTVPDAAAAATETGLAVPRVAGLPRGVRGEPVHQAAGEVSATFTFSAARAAEAAGEDRGTATAPPAGLDGSQVRLVAGPGVASIWAGPTGMPAMIVGRAVAPRAFSSGAPFEAIRDHLLSLPGVPDDVARELRRFAADGSTLPLPLPADAVTTSTVDIGGSTATVVATRDRTMAAVVWLEDGVVNLVAGSLDADEVVSVARGLR
jgi:hypothetical protein